MSGYKVKKNETLYFNFAQKLSIRGIQNIVHNRSVAGDTSSKAFKRIKSVIADNPDIVILCLGANDMLQAIPPDIIYKNMESIILRFKEENTIIVLVGMLASRILNKKYISQFDSIFPDLAKKNRAAEFDGSSRLVIKDPGEGSPLDFDNGDADDRFEEGLRPEEGVPEDPGILVAEVEDFLRNQPG